MPTDGTDTHSTKEKPSNVLLFGETGVGKSSVINMLVGQEISLVSDAATGCTLENKCYTTRIEGRPFALWDTVGLNEGNHGSVASAHAENKLRLLVLQMGEPDLLVYVMHATRFRRVMQINYDLVYRRICGERVPIVAVITGLENEKDMDSWWVHHGPELRDHSLVFRDNACITASRGAWRNGCYRHEDEYQESIKKVKQVLFNNCPIPLDPVISPNWNEGISKLDVVVVGEVGIGKSAVVNLIAGKAIAPVSDINPCTENTKEYRLRLGSSTINVWDTKGLDPSGAIEITRTLLQKPRVGDSVRLLLFCIRANRWTSDTQAVYSLIYEVLRKKRISVGLVVTHLEGEPKMEDWWQRNSKHLGRHGFTSHACVTGLEEHEKYAQSREVIHDLLSRLARTGTEPWGNNWLRKLSSGGQDSRGQDTYQAWTRVDLVESDEAQPIARPASGPVIAE